jgi:hypothetical protein
MIAGELEGLVLRNRTSNVSRRIAGRMGQGRGRELVPARVIALRLALVVVSVARLPGNWRSRNEPQKLRCGWDVQLPSRRR